MIALRNMLVLTILVLSVVGSTFARVYLLNGSTVSPSIAPQSSPLKQSQLNTSIFLVNHTQAEPTTESQTHQSSPINLTNARQLDLDNPVYYKEDNSPEGTLKSADPLIYNESNFTYGNMNLRRVSNVNGDTLSPQHHRTAGVTFNNGHVPISRVRGEMSKLEIAHLMNSGHFQHVPRGQMQPNRRQHQNVVRQKMPPHAMRPIYAKPPNGVSNRHTLSAQIKQNVAAANSPRPYQVANATRQYYETSRRPAHPQMPYRPQKRQPIMLNTERFRPSKPFNLIPIGAEQKLVQSAPHYLKTNISSAFQRQFVKNPSMGNFKPPIGLRYNVKQPSFIGQDSKATGDESLDNYQTIGAHLGPTPKRNYKPEPLTGPFYTYPNIMQRPIDSKMPPSQMFTPVRTPNFAHGNLGDRYPLRQHPHVISTSLKNSNPLTLAPNHLQNINFENSGQLQVLQFQPELIPQYASSFPTLSQQTSQYDKHPYVVPNIPLSQNEIAIPSHPSRYPFQPTLQSPIPTRISSSLINAGQGLSGQNLYQPENTPTVYKVHGTYTESTPKPKQSPMKPSVQYDEDVTSGLSAILNANYRQPDEAGSRFKPEDSNTRFKPEETDTRYKPQETVFQYKPEDSDTRFKPEETDTRYKPQETVFRYKPENPDTRFKPEESETQYKPETPETHYKPEESSHRYKPNNRPSLPGPPYEDDDEITKYGGQKPILEEDEEFQYQESPTSYDAPLVPKGVYNNDYKSDDHKSPSYPPYPPSKESSPGSVHDILSESSGKIPSSSYGVPDSSLHGNSYDPHGGGGHKKGGHVHTFVKTTKEGHFKWGVRHSVPSH